MTDMQLDVMAVGNAIVDVIARTDEAFLAAHGMAKGAMALIDETTAHTLYEAMGSGTQTSGGSAANTVAGLTALGVRAGYIGKVRDDSLGRVFRHDLAATGVRFDTPAVPDGPATARCLVLVTEDGQRTMNTFLGACVELTPDDIDPAQIETAAITYLEGYLFDLPLAKAAFRKAASIARAARRKVALSLSDSFCVHRHRDEFRNFIAEHIDILFANAEEIAALYDTIDVTAAARLAAADCAVVAVTLGADGSLLIDADGLVRVPAVPVPTVVDTTGAGDLYAAGVLCGLTHGLSLEASGRLGSALAGEVIGHLGARPQADITRLLPSGLRFALAGRAFGRKDRAGAA